MKKVLVVDRDQAYLDRLSKALLGAGHVVVSASDATGAKQIYADVETRPGVVVVDYNISDNGISRYNGATLIAELRKMGPPSAHMYLMSDARLSGWQQHADGFYHKHENPDIFLQMLDDNGGHNE